MNKILMMAAFITSVAANAVVIPGMPWDRPVLQAQLTELDSDGHELGIGLKKILTMHQRNSSTPSSFTLSEEMRVYCIKAPCPPIRNRSKFIIKAITPAGCGSTKYIALEQTQNEDVLDTLSFPTHVLTRRLEVVDHGSRICEDYKKHMWEVKLFPAVGNTLTRFFVGDPEPVYTIQ